MIHSLEVNVNVKSQSNSI